MTPSELHSIASACYGARWQSQLARDMGVSLRNIQRWARDGIAKPATAEGVRRFLEERRISRIAAPPEGSTPDQNRDDACYEALRPGVLALLAAASDIGWHPAEAWVAVLAVTVDAMRDGAGDDATLDVLRQVVQSLDG